MDLIRRMAEHGGLQRTRDDGALSSALACPDYGDPDLAALAAAYAFGLARHHPLTDGNKRTSSVVFLTFLALNGAGLPIADEENVVAWLALADGSLEEAALADWLPARLRKVD